MQRAIVPTLGMISLFSLSTNSYADIPIGIAGPMTGGYAAFGEQLARGAEQAIADINAAGGIHGEALRLVTLDDACEPKQAVTVANRFVDQEEVSAVIGHFCSSSTIPATFVYADADVLMITPASTNPAVTAQAFPTIFRNCGRDDQQGITAAKFVTRGLRASRIAVIHDKDTYGKGLADALVDEIDNMGYQPVLYEGLTRGEKDFNALVTRLKRLSPDVIYFGGMHTEAGPFVRQLREQGVDAPFVSGDGVVSEEFVVAAGGKPNLVGVYMTFGADPRDTPEGASVVSAFRDNGYEPEGYTLYSYASVEIVAEAMKAVSDPLDGYALATWLHANPVNTIIGEKTWDDAGDLIDSDYVVYRWNAEGHYVPHWQPA